MTNPPLRIAINGFGRIGRTILRTLLLSRCDTGIEVICINDIAPLENSAYLFEFDSVFGPYPGAVATTDTKLVIDTARYLFHRKSDISTLDLSSVDVLLECTGKATTRSVAERGLKAGAKAVLISGPSDAADATVVMGANESILKNHKIVSNASCTTNALAPILRLLDKLFGVTSAHMTTIHCYTGSQPTIDSSRDDLARSRAAALSMVPTTTSASRLIDKVVPSLAGKITGAAIRVPVASVSAMDLVFQLNNRPSDFAQQLKSAIGASPVLGWTDKPLVSTDLRARPESLVISGLEMIEGPDFTRLLGWYDNEWGFSNRMIDMALMMGTSMHKELSNDK